MKKKTVERPPDGMLVIGDGLGFCVLNECTELGGKYGISCWQ
jgi:hypothetical protein